jgi:RNA:NAD 2'-phosphotransferase (TPT1/KptA family)
MAKLYHGTSTTNAAKIKKAGYIQGPVYLVLRLQTNITEIVHRKL